MSKINYLLFIILIWLQYSLWLGRNGIFDYIHVYNTTKLYKNTCNVDQKRIFNNQLLLEIHDLLYGYEAIEEHARYHLGMIKSDECFYQIQY